MSPLTYLWAHTAVSHPYRAYILCPNQFIKYLASKPNALSYITYQIKLLYEKNFLKEIKKLLVTIAMYVFGVSIQDPLRQ